MSWRAKAERELAASGSANPSAAWAEAFLNQAQVSPELVPDYIEIFVNNSVDESSVALFEKQDLLGTGIRIGDALKILRHAKKTGRAVGEVEGNDTHRSALKVLAELGLDEAEQRNPTAQDIATAKHLLRSLKPQMGFGFGAQNPLAVELSRKAQGNGQQQPTSRKGIKVTTVQPDHPADQAGLCVDDIIAAIGGVSVFDKVTFLVAFKKLNVRPGDRVPFKVFRGDLAKPIEIMMTVGAHGYTLKQIMDLRRVAESKSQEQVVKERKQSAKAQDENFGYEDDDEGGDEIGLTVVDDMLFHV